MFLQINLQIALMTHLLLKQIYVVIAPRILVQEQGHPVLTAE